MSQEESFCKKQIGVDPDVKGSVVLIKSVDVPTKTSSNLLLPNASALSAQRELHIGQILKIGPAAFQERFDSYRCEVGDFIEYSTYERAPTNPNKHICYYISDDKIFSKISEEDLPQYMPYLTIKK